jgi:hypothetical protein
VSTVSSLRPVLDQLAELGRKDSPVVVSDPQFPTSLLVKRLSQMPDRRKRRGRRHGLVVVLTLASCAMLVVGNDSVTAIWQWAARTSQEVLSRIGARRDPLQGRYLVPSERTFRRILGDLDCDALDAATCGFAADVVRGLAPVPVVPQTPGPVEREERRVLQRDTHHPRPAGLLAGIAVDGKALRGSVTGGARTFLLGAIAHDTGVALASARFRTRREKAPRWTRCWHRCRRPDR